MKRRVNRKSETVTVTIERFDAEMIRAAIYYLHRYDALNQHCTKYERELLLEIEDKLKWPE